MISVTVEQGKYHYIVEMGRIKCLRFGQPWIDNLNEQPGGKAMIALIGELEEAREEIEQLRRYIGENEQDES